jgi:hypothetical protein
METIILVPLVLFLVGGGGRQCSRWHREERDLGAKRNSDAAVQVPLHFSTKDY